MTETQIGRNSVLKALRERAPKAMHLMEVVASLKVPKSRRDEVRDVLDELRGLGMVKEMPGNRFRMGEKPKKAAPPPPEAKKSGTREKDGPGLSGWLTIHPRGFGFVAVEDGGPDVFVPGSKLKHAMHGDRVRISAQPSAKGRDGEVLEVVRHGVKRVTGVLRTKRKDAWLDTSDPRLPERVEVVGTIPLGIEDGEEVVALIQSWPKYEGDQMEARVLSALGPRGSAAVEIEKIKIREGIEEEFDEDVLAEAQSWGSEVSQEEIENREDLRDYELCTIDPPTARDHDDAVWAERLEGGGFRVIVAIADVSHYVREGTALDAAALERATSIYLPDRVIPMLPHELSSNLASLVPDEDRLCMAVEVELGAKGAIKKHRFIEGVMRSRARISYEGAARALRLSEAPAVQHAAEERRDLLTVLYDASQVLRAKRRRRGSLDFDLPEPEIVLDDQSEPIDIKRSRTDPGVRKCYAMIEDLMLLANEVVAADLSRRGLPAIYRVHGAPDEQRIDVFAELAESLGYVLDEDAGSDPRKLAKFLKRVEGTTHAQALNFLLLRAMQQATYDTANVGHFALAAKNYLHFTSPIRRYPDLAVHRVVRAIVRRKKIDKGKLQDKLRQQAAASSRLERRAMTIDREANNLYRALLMKDRTGERFEATVTGVAEHGLYVTFEEPFVEARVPIDTLGDDWYELDALGLRLVGTRTGQSFALGDRITVRLENVSIEQRELSAVVEQRLPDDRELLSPPDERRRRQRKQRKKGKEERNQARASKRKRYEDERKGKKGGRSLDGTTPRKKTRTKSGATKKKKGSTRGKRR
ncbi:MAG: ribonuclease R [Myxococcota bacterium]|nr:ribonuclease R [Myxococcota bacterium]